MYGTFFRNLDDKKRVVIPSKFRYELGNKFFITVGPDKNLDLRSEEEFKAFRDRLLAINTLSKNARAFARTLLGNTFEVELDKQGRVMIEASLLQKTGITKEVAFVGLGNKVELWDKSTYENFDSAMAEEGSLDDLAEKLSMDGIKL